MRLIDADALMKELEREVELADDWKTAHEIANVVKYFPTIEPQRWIPVTEREPHHELAIVQYNDGDFGLLQFPTAYRWKDIVAWMPLPEPYKEKQNETD